MDQNWTPIRKPEVPKCLYSSIRWGFFTLKAWNLSLTDRSVIFKDAKDFLFCISLSCLDTRETFLTPILIPETLYKKRGAALCGENEYILNVNLINVRGPNHNFHTHAPH